LGRLLSPPQQANERKDSIVKKKKQMGVIETGTQEIPLTSLTLVADTQARTGLRENVLEDYAEAMRDGAKFPPISVVSDGSTTWVWDGWHRVVAARSIDANADIAASVIHGTLDDAIWLAASANRTHGCRRTNTDKVRALMLALRVRPEESLRVIAEWCGVSHEMVRQYKQSLQASAEIEQAAVEVADGQRVEVIEEGTPVSQAMSGAQAAISLVLKAIDALETKVEALADSKHGAWINRQSVMSDISNARSAVAHAAPHEQCPVCVGSGCATCRELGWVSRKQWQLIPKRKTGERGN